MRRSERSITSSLRRHGYRLTPQRRVVVHAIAASEDHLTPAAIYDKVSQEHPSIGLVTVYRTLEILSELDLICELHAAGSCPSYTISNPQHHHHLVCSDCGKVVDFAGHDLAALEERLSQESGFAIEDHHLEFIGHCRQCQETAAQTPA